MKKLFLIFLTLLFVININAQINTGKYVPSLYQFDTCQYLQQFIGTWLYTNVNDTIRFYFRVHKDSSENLHYISTSLYGWHEYKQGNIVIESNYQDRFNTLPYFCDTVKNLSNSISLIGATLCNSQIDTLRGSIIDLSQNRERHIIKAIITRYNGIITMQWNQNHREWYGSFTGATGMTLPKQFVLTKQ